MAIPSRRRTDESADLRPRSRHRKARPIVEDLLKRGWDNKEFLQLCREHGLLPAPPVREETTQ